MINKPTVFVLGAGASEPFGFPTGRGLVAQTLKNLRTDHVVEMFIKELGYPVDTVLGFRNALESSGRNSVDAFLEHREEFIDVGKAAIAYELIRKETERPLFDLSDKNWLRYLYDQMNCPFEAFGKNRVSFISFNYDRVVEHFMFTTLRNDYGKTEEECVRQATIQMIHLHGQMGSLPWQGYQELGTRPFNPGISAATIEVDKRGIKIIHEKLDGGRDKDFELAKEWIAEAARVYFLGFGFGETNCERLGLRSPLTGKHICATGVGLTLGERGRLRERVTPHIKFTQYDCIGLLRNKVAW